jgi:hypothetical protein
VDRIPFDAPPAFLQTTDFFDRSKLYHFHVILHLAKKREGHQKVSYPQVPVKQSADTDGCSDCSPTKHIMGKHYYYKLPYYILLSQLTKYIGFIGITGYRILDIFWKCTIDW